MTTRPLPIGTRVTAPDGRTGTVIEPNFACGDNFERIIIDTNRIVLRYRRTDLRVASPVETGLQRGSTQIVPTGALLALAVLAMFGGLALAWVVNEINPVVPPCEVVAAGHEDPAQAADDMNWIVEQFARVDYLGSYDGSEPGQWIGQEDSTEPTWVVIGWAAAEDSTIYDRPDCVPGF
jgi:hypothetical protein